MPHLQPDGRVRPISENIRLRWQSALDVFDELKQQSHSWGCKGLDGPVRPILEFKERQLKISGHIMARIFLAVVKQGLVDQVISQCELSTTHEITVCETLTAAYKSLESEHFDLIVCDVCFDDSQILDIWSAVKRKEPRVTFLAYRERDSDLGKAMELLVQKAVLDMGLDGYLDLREFQAPDDCTAFVDFIELGLKSGKLKK